MKNAFLVLGFAVICSCSDSSTTSKTEESGDTGVTSSGTPVTTGSNASYVDLNTGQNIQIQLDTTTWVTTDVITGKPVQIYVNTSTMDTFDTKGRIVNNALIKTDAGWNVDETKIKMDGDEMKYKSGDTKMKTDGDDSKMKTDDIKIKSDDGDVKVKDK